MEALGEDFELTAGTCKAQWQHNKFWPRWTRSIYVANLPYSADEHHVAEYFTTFGEVLAVRMPVDESRGTSKGYGWVEFLERSAYYAALEADGEDFMGRDMRILKTRKPEPRENRMQRED